MANVLPKEKQIAVVAALVEGNSIRSTVRMTGTAKNTIVKLLVALGSACRKYQDRAFRNLKCNRLQCDEIWSFCYAKEKNVPESLRGHFGYGDVWTWVAIDRDTKLIPCWHVGRRDAVDAKAFIDDLAGRLARRVQLSTDGLRLYVDAIDDAFGNEIDYGMIVKVYGFDRTTHNGTQSRYSPAIVESVTKNAMTGNPDPAHICTSHIERQNLTMRMSMRRFTRLTNGFSKKVQNQIAMINLFYLYYNFCRIHQTLRVTPAMAAGVSDHVWEIADLVALLG